jgi:hypothetical protein
MEMQNPSPPPKNFQISKPQVIETLQSVIQDAGKLGVTPDKFVQMGNFALQVVKDKSLYPIFTQALIENKLAEPNEVPKNVDIKMLGHFVALGKIAKQMTGDMA